MRETAFFYTSTKMYLLLLLLVPTYSVMSTLVPTQLITDYFKSLNIYSVTILVCSSEDEKIKIIKQFLKTGFMTSFSLEAVSDVPKFRTGAVLDLACNFTAEVIEKFTVKKTIGVHTEWLFLDTVNSTNSLQMTESLHKLEDAYILPGSYVTICQVSELDVSYYDVYRTSVVTPLKYHLLSKQKTNSFHKLPSRPERKDFGMITLQTAAVLYHPEMFSGLTDFNNPEIDTIPKITSPIVRNLAEQLNFSIDIRILGDYGWLVNDTFSGLMGMLQRNEIDLACTGIFMRPDRMNAVDFTGDTFEIRNMIIFKQPALSSVSNIFVLPFTTMVWLCCAALAVVTTALLILDVAARVGNRRAFNQDATTSDMVTIIIGFICQQGSSLEPTSVSSRITLFLFSLCSLFLYTSYSANIVALLQSSSATIKSLADLTKSPLAVSAQDAVYIKIYFEETNDEKVKRLYDIKVKPQGENAYLTAKEGIKKVRSGLFAFDMEAHTGYKMISDTFLETEKCSLDEMRLFLLPKLSIPVVKKSGYREHFTQKITLQREVGLHSQISRFWLPVKPACDSTGRGYVSVGLTDFKPALLIICWGVFFSLLAFIGEIIFNHRGRIWKKFEKKKDDKWNIAN